MPKGGGPAPDSARDRAIGALQVAAGAAMISFSGVFREWAAVEPTAAAFYRAAIGGLILVVIALAMRARLWAGMRRFLLMVVAAAIFTADLWLWHRSIDYVGTGLATLLTNFQVFLMAAFGILVLRERLTWRPAVAVPMAMAGLYLIVGREWGALSGGYRRGVWLGLLTAFTYAAYVLVLRRMQTRTDLRRKVATLAGITGLMAAMLAALSLAEGQSLRIPDVRSGAALLGYGSICHVLAWVLISLGAPKIEAQRIGLLLLVQPTLAFVWDVGLFGRAMHPPDVAGAALALAAIYLGNTRAAGRRPERGQGSVS
ncbi:MAG: DMT family transporter [Planctomycetota bacterium]